MIVKEEIDLLQVVKNHFGIVDTPYQGHSFILPDGYFLDLRRCRNHSEVEKYLIDAGLSDYEYGISLGSPTLMDLDCIRIDTLKYYITLPKYRINGEQINSLLIWLDYLSKTTHLVEVIAGNQHIVYHLDNEIISDYVVDRIKRYYTTSKLYVDFQQ